MYDLMQHETTPDICTFDGAVSFEEDGEKVNSRHSAILSPKKNKAMNIRPAELSPRNRGQSVYNHDNGYFIQKMEHLLKYVSHPGKANEIENLLRSFGNLEVEEIELAIRRKNQLILTKNVKHRETEFLNAIDMLNLKEYQKMLDEEFVQEQLRLQNQPSNSKSKKGTKRGNGREGIKSANNLQNISQRPSMRNFLQAPDWNTSGRLVPFKEDNFKSNIYGEFQSTSKVNFGERAYSRAAMTDNKSKHRASKNRSVSTNYQKKNKQFGLSLKDLTYDDYKKIGNESIANSSRNRIIGESRNQSMIEQSHSKPKRVVGTKKDTRKPTTNSRVAAKRKNDTKKKIPEERNTSCTKRLKSMINDANVGYMKDKGGLSYWGNDSYMKDKRTLISDREGKNEGLDLNDENLREQQVISYL